MYSSWVTHIRWLNEASLVSWLKRWEDRPQGDSRRWMLHRTGHCHLSGARTARTENKIRARSKEGYFWFKPEDHRTKSFVTYWTKYRNLISKWIIYGFAKCRIVRGMMEYLGESWGLGLTMGTAGLTVLVGSMSPKDWASPLCLCLRVWDRVTEVLPVLWILFMWNFTQLGFNSLWIFLPLHMLRTIRKRDYWVRNEKEKEVK